MFKNWKNNKKSDGTLGSTKVTSLLKDIQKIMVPRRQITFFNWGPSYGQDPVLVLVLVRVGQSTVIDLALMPSLLLSSHVTHVRKHVAVVFQAHQHKIMVFMACVFSLGFHMLRICSLNCCTYKLLRKLLRPAPTIFSVFHSNLSRRAGYKLIW